MKTNTFREVEKLDTITKSQKYAREMTERFALLTKQTNSIRS